MDDGEFSQLLAVMKKLESLIIGAPNEYNTFLQLVLDSHSNVGSRAKTIESFFDLEVWPVLESIDSDYVPVILEFYRQVKTLANEAIKRKQSHFDSFRLCEGIHRSFSQCRQEIHNGNINNAVKQFDSGCEDLKKLWNVVKGENLSTQDSLPVVPTHDLRSFPPWVQIPFSTYYNLINELEGVKLGRQAQLKLLGPGGLLNKFQNELDDFHTQLAQQNATKISKSLANNEILANQLKSENSHYLHFPPAEIMLQRYNELKEKAEHKLLRIKFRGEVLAALDKWNRELSDSEDKIATGADRKVQVKKNCSNINDAVRKHCENSHWKEFEISNNFMRRYERVYHYINADICEFHGSDFDAEKKFWKTLHCMDAAFIQIEKLLATGSSNNALTSILQPSGYWNKLQNNFAELKLLNEEEKLSKFASDEISSFLPSRFAYYSEWIDRMTPRFSETSNVNSLVQTSRKQAESMQTKLHSGSATSLPTDIERTKDLFEQLKQINSKTDKTKHIMKLLQFLLDSAPARIHECEQFKIAFGIFTSISKLIFDMWNRMIGTGDIKNVFESIRTKFDSFDITRDSGISLEYPFVIELCDMIDQCDRDAAEHIKQYSRFWEIRKSASTCCSSMNDIINLIMEKKPYEACKKWKTVENFNQEIWANNWPTDDPKQPLLNYTAAKYDILSSLMIKITQAAEQEKLIFEANRVLRSVNDSLAQIEISLRKNQPRQARQQFDILQRGINQEETFERFAQLGIHEISDWCSSCNSKLLQLDEEIKQELAATIVMQKLNGTSELFEQLREALANGEEQRATRAFRNLNNIHSELTCEYTTVENVQQFAEDFGKFAKLYKSELSLLSSRRLVRKPLQTSSNLLERLEKLLNKTAIDPELCLRTWMKIKEISSSFRQKSEYDALPEVQSFKNRYEDAKTRCEGDELQQMFAGEQISELVKKIQEIQISLNSHVQNNLFDAAENCVRDLHTERNLLESIEPRHEFLPSIEATLRETNLKLENEIVSRFLRDAYVIKKRSFEVLENAKIGKSSFIDISRSIEQLQEFCGSLNDSSKEDIKCDIIEPFKGVIQKLEKSREIVANWETARAIISQIEKLLSPLETKLQRPITTTNYRGISNSFRVFEETVFRVIYHCPDDVKGLEQLSELFYRIETVTKAYETSALPEISSFFCAAIWKAIQPAVTILTNHFDTLQTLAQDTIVKYILQYSVPFLSTFSQFSGSQLFQNIHDAYELAIFHEVLLSDSQRKQIESFQASNSPKLEEIAATLSSGGRFALSLTQFDDINRMNLEAYSQLFPIIQTAAARENIQKILKFSAMSPGRLPSKVFFDSSILPSLQCKDARISRYFKSIENSCETLQRNSQKLRETIESFRVMLDNLQCGFGLMGLDYCTSNNRSRCISSVEDIHKDFAVLQSKIETTESTDLDMIRIHMDLLDISVKDSIEQFKEIENDLDSSLHVIEQLRIPGQSIYAAKEIATVVGYELKNNPSVDLSRFTRKYSFIQLPNSMQFANLHRFSAELVSRTLTKLDKLVLPICTPKALSYVIGELEYMGKQVLESLRNKVSSIITQAMKQKAWEFAVQYSAEMQSVFPDLLLELQKKLEMIKKERDAEVERKFLEKEEKKRILADKQRKLAAAMKKWVFAYAKTAEISCNGESFGYANGRISAKKTQRKICWAGRVPVDFASDSKLFPFVWNGQTLTRVPRFSSNPREGFVFDKEKKILNSSFPYQGFLNGSIQITAIDSCLKWNITFPGCSGISEIVVNEDCTECRFGERVVNSDNRVAPQVLIFVAILDVYWKLAETAVKKYNSFAERRRQQMREYRSSQSGESQEASSWTQNVFNSLDHQISVLVEDSPRSNFGLTTTIGSHTHTSVHISKGCRIRVKGGGTYPADYGNEIVIP